MDAGSWHQEDAHKDPAAGGGRGRGFQAFGQIDVFALGEPGGGRLGDHIAEEIVDEVGGTIDRLVDAGARHHQVARIIGAPCIEDSHPLLPAHRDRGEPAQMINAPD